MRLVFWQNMQSIHQSAHLRALATHKDCEVTLVTAEEITAERRKAKWHVPNFSGVRQVVNPSRELVEQLLTHAEANSVHVFSGFNANTLIRTALRRGLSTRAMLGVYSEAEEWAEGWKGKARLIRGRWYTRYYKERVDFILAVGSKAVRWFHMIGYPDDMIYRYGYFLEKPQHIRHCPGPTEGGKVELVFVGRLLRLKGVDLLISALYQLRGLDWRLRIVGDGPERSSLETQCRESGLEERVSFLGMRENAEAMRVIEDSDLLVLPSRRDGWGAVVSEALLRGVPAVCSTNCGAADLLASPQRGETFIAGSSSDLARVLRRRISSGKRTPDQTEYILRWSEAIRGETAAEYMLDVVEACRGRKVKPVPPWMQDEVRDD